MDDNNSLVQHLSIPLSSARGWILFIGILSIISGVLTALSIVGILWAWLPIWLGVLLCQAASGMGQAAINGDTATFLRAQEKLRLCFIIYGITIIVAFVLVGLVLVFGGMAMIMGLAHHTLPSATL